MSRPLVHVVDDDPDAVELLCSYLENVGLETRYSLSGQQALRNLVEDPADLILLDVQMPGLDGFETLAELRSREGLQTVPVIFVSSLDRPNLKIRALDMGADDYVVKPFNSAELVARLRAVLRRGRRSVDPNGLLEGDLQQFPLPLVLQTVSLMGRVATVRFPERRLRPEDDPVTGSPEALDLRRQGLWAWILVSGGRLHGARLGPHHDREALVRLLLCRGGRFETDFDRPIVPVTGEGLPVDGILLRLLVEIDEARAVLEPAVGLDRTLRPAAGAGPELAEWLAGGLATPRQMLIRSRRPLAETATAVAQACRAGTLEPVDEKEQPT